MNNHSHDQDDLALGVLELAADIRRFADRVHHTYGRRVAGDLLRAAITVEQTYRQLARGSLAARPAAPEPRADPSVDLSYPQPGRTSGGGGWPRRRR